MASRAQSSTVGGQIETFRIASYTDTCLTWISALIWKAWKVDTVKEQPSSFKYMLRQKLHQLKCWSYVFTSWWWSWRFAPCNTNGNVKKKSPILPLLPPPFFLRSASPSFCSCTPPPLSRLSFCWHQRSINGLFVCRSVFTLANLIKGGPRWCVHARALKEVSAEEQRIIRSTTVLVQTI